MNAQGTGRALGDHGPAIFGTRGITFGIRPCPAIILSSATGSANVNSSPLNNRGKDPLVVEGERSGR